MRTELKPIDRNILAVVHQWLQDILAPGDTAIDATVGNGHDTLFLAQSVGKKGQVYGFDIQADALTTAQERLEEAGIATRVTLLNQGHEYLREALPQQAPATLKAIMFNLGYLPGHQAKDVITQPETTRRALEQAIDLLAPGGLITLVLYTGHPGGGEEAQAVIDWASTLDPRHYTVVRYELLNQKNHPPYAIGIAKR